MPGRAPHPCTVPGCSALILSGRRCQAHKVQAEHGRPNLETRRWYRTPQWKALRARVIFEADYQCAGCGRIVLALEVDHILRHGGVYARFWDRANLQALCRSCHQRKTQRGE